MQYNIGYLCKLFNLQKYERIKNSFSKHLKIFRGFIKNSNSLPLELSSMEIFRSISHFYLLYVKTFVEIMVISFLLYQVYKILEKQIMSLIRGGLSILIIYTIAYIFRLTTLLWIIHAIAPGFIIAIAIVFQPEMRKIFLKIGQNNWFSFGKKAFNGQLDSVLTAAELLSEEKRGMLVIFLRNNNLQDIIETGTILNADLTASLLVTIFKFDTPLHDGATIVRNDKIISAGCFLPLSEQQDIKKSFGTRHRASLGITEQSDAVVLVVSEETGALSLAYDSNLYYDLSRKEIIERLERLLNIKALTGAIEVEERLEKL